MSENTIHSLTSTLATQPLLLPDPSLQPGNTQGGGDLAQIPHPAHNPVAPQVLNPPVVVNPDGTNPEQPVKRRPGRPKGSGKKPVDPNAEPKVKRPVGRPRKDGLPAGSVGPRRASRPRKRPPGTFASGGTAPPGGYPYGPAFPHFAPSDPAQAQWRTSISVPPMGSMSRGGPPLIAYPIDPTLDRDNWAELARARPDVFLQALVSALTAPNPVSTAGPSVEEAFKSHLVSLAATSKNASPSIPSLYFTLKTFWLPSSPPYFSLTASTSTARTPSEHRFLYWDPQPLVFNGIACPACNTPLQNNGRISSGPIKVYDLGQPFFIIGCEYVCKGPCAGGSPDGRKFSSVDASILRALPSKLLDEFPAHLLPGNPDLGSGADVWTWHGLGVSQPLWNMVRASLRVGLRKDAILEVVRAIQFGVPEEVYQQQEEEEEGRADEEGSHEEEQQVDGELDYAKDKATEAYNEAWNANSGVPEAQAMENQAGPSNAVESSGSAAPQAAHEDPGISRPASYQQFPQTPQAPYAMAFPYAAYPYFQPGQHADAGQNSLKRAFSIVDGSPDSSMGEPMQKRIRHCCKCGSSDCKGKGGRAFCTNPCQDCGKLDCKGRNSKRPDRTCADAWP
ncbi:hypothetical protein BKA93DRAFT_823354 [Sparassis latifolia]